MNFIKDENDNENSKEKEKEKHTVTSVNSLSMVLRCSTIYIHFYATSLNSVEIISRYELNGFNV